jgi:DNA-binding NarL/FixJ family response regulator
VLTASSESSDVNRAYDLGANSYLVKPVTFDSLVEMVKTLNLYWLILNKRADVSDE